MVQTAFKWTGKEFGQGVRKTLNRLGAFKRSLGKKWLRQAANKASQVHLKALKSTSPGKHRDWGSGQWRKSLGRKVRLFNQSGGRFVVWWAVGPRSAKLAIVPQKFKWFRRDGRVMRVPVTERTPERFKNRKMWPVKYSHLVEKKRHPIERANRQVQSAVATKITEVLTAAMASV